MIRSNRPVEALAPQISAILRDIDLTLPTGDYRTLEEIVNLAVSPRRFILLLIGAFAVIALFLASLGIYGVVAYSVSQQTREIGIRIALGAGGGSIRNTIIREGMLLTAVGIILGLGTAYFLTSLMSTLVYDIGVTDPLTFILVAVSLAVISWLTCFIPALRVTRSDPLEIMRTD